MSLWYNIWMQHKILPTLQIYNKDNYVKLWYALLYISTLILKDLNYVSALDKKMEEFGFLPKQTIQNITTKLFHQKKSIKLVIEVKINLVKGFFI